MKYALIDTANTFFRARHVASRSSTLDEKIGMALHLTLASCNQMVRKFGIDHVVFCLEGRSWRKDYYEPYKKNRVVDTLSQTEAEVEENKMFWDTYEKFTTFLREKTNVSVLRDPKAEADDLIARFIHLHPDSEHFIISSDTDYIQLITDKVKQYNGVTGQLITLEGYFDDKGRVVKDKKTKEPKNADESERLLRGFLSKALFDNGLYCRADDRGDPVVQLAPPLIVGQKEFDEMEQMLRAVLSEGMNIL